MFCCSCLCCLVLPLLKPRAFALDLEITVSRLFVPFLLIPRPTFTQFQRGLEKAAQHLSFLPCEELSGLRGSRYRVSVPSLAPRLLRLLDQPQPSTQFAEGRVLRPKFLNKHVECPGLGHKWEDLPPSFTMQAEQSPVVSGCWPEISEEKGHSSPSHPSGKIQVNFQSPTATTLGLRLWAQNIFPCSPTVLPPPLCVVGFLSLQNDCGTGCDAFGGSYSPAKG